MPSPCGDAVSHFNKVAFHNISPEQILAGNSKKSDNILQNSFDIYAILRFFCLIHSAFGHKFAFGVRPMEKNKLLNYNIRVTKNNMLQKFKEAKK